MPLLSRFSKNLKLNHYFRLFLLSIRKIILSISVENSLLNIKFRIKHQKISTIKPKKQVKNILKFIEFLKTILIEFSISRFITMFIQFKFNNSKIKSFIISVISF